MSNPNSNYLQSLQDQSDESKLNLIQSLLSCLSIQPRPRSKSLSQSFTSSSLHSISSRSNISCSISLLNTLSKNKVCIFYSDSREQYHIIYENFINLYRKNLSHGSRLNQEKPEIFFTVIKQFFLDKYLITEDFFEIINNLLRREKWIDIFTFTECIEQVQTNFFHGFYYLFVNPPGNIKDRIEKQKIICSLYLVFYKFVDSKEKGQLNQLELIETLKFSFPHMKEGEVVKRVHDIVTKCNIKRNQVKQSVGLMELVSILFN